MSVGPGTVIGAGYVLAEVLGEEMLGTVWRARVAAAAGFVRVKLLRAEGDNERFHRFQREAEAIGRVRHPSLLRLLDQGEHEGVPFLVFEHTDARTLDALIREGPLDPARAARLALGVAQGLGAAHREGVVHRNLTAANVLVADGDEVKLRDFGLATMVGGEVPTQLTRDEARIGSAVAMSPEYVADAEVGPKGDVYALGVLLYQATTGRPPFEGRDALARKVVERPDPPSTVRADLPDWVDGLAGQLLAALPEDRPEIDEVIARLERVVRGAAEPVRPETAGRPLFAMGLVLAVVALLAVVGVLVLTMPRLDLLTVALQRPPSGLEVTEAPDEVVPLEPVEPAPVVELTAVAPRPHASPAPVLVATLRVRSNRRVLVEVDGQVAGFAPVDVRVPSGPHRVVVALPARPDTIREQTIDVVRGAEPTLRFVF